MRIINFILLGIVVFLFCCDAPVVKSSLNPETAPDSFVRAVKAGNFDLAKSFWKKGSIEHIERNYGMPFNQFCMQKFSSDHYSISKATKQKERYYRVQYVGVQDGKETRFSFYLECDNNQLMLVETRWLVENGK